MKSFHRFLLVVGVAVSWSVASWAQTSPTKEEIQESDSFAYPGTVSCTSAVHVKWEQVPANKGGRSVNAAVGKLTPPNEYLVFDGPVAQVSVALNFQISGQILSALMEVTNAEVTSTATFVAQANVGDQVFSGNMTMTSSASDSAHTNLLSATGLLASFDGNLRSGRTAAFVVPVGEPLSFQLLVSEQTSVDIQVPQEATEVSVWADAEASDTLSLPTQGPVFDLPAGVTVSSFRLDPFNGQQRLSGCINDNTYSPLPEITKSTNGLSVSWPGRLGDFKLESTASLVPPVVWSPETNVVAVEGQCLHPVAVAPPSRFYRLRK